ncbi:hypothetical protein [Alkalihalobacterium elongatum]|uniref:hypothetical protein n=1 Tax=Alkalihalobacterium elongatum TaxID=2675466 RepID=UPI001C200F50|nr:hypothetical protein [Alkalihalobacterium elongatum]
MDKKIVDLVSTEMKGKIDEEIVNMTFTKNFRSATAEEWYIFLKNYKDPKTGGAAGKAIIHYDLQGNRDIFINTTIIMDDPMLYKNEWQPLLYAICDELINRLVGYANTLLAVHAGENSYEAEYVR